MLRHAAHAGTSGYCQVHKTKAQHSIAKQSQPHINLEYLYKHRSAALTCCASCNRPACCYLGNAALLSSRNSLRARWQDSSCADMLPRRSSTRGSEAKETTLPWLCDRCTAGKH